MSDLDALLLKQIENWTPEARAKALVEFKNRSGAERKIWYCARGRSCGGKPHRDVPYNHARPDQWPPPGTDWLTWLVRSGRGSGKTRTGAEWTRSITSRAPQIALIGRRGVDVRATMIEGTSGLIKACEFAGVGYDWQPSKREFTFANGAKAFGYSGEEPDSLRGREHAAAWVDEPCHIDLIEEVWSNLEFTLRLPGMPGGAKILATSTPLPLPWLKDLIKKSTTVDVAVSTYDNLDNLDPGMRARILEKYEGTRKGRQEIMGEILEDVEGALWSEELIRHVEERPGFFDRIVVAVDPAGTANRRSDETGIVVVGKRGQTGYVLDDVSGKMSPVEWATAALTAYQRWSADVVVVEKNFGGDMVKSTVDSVAKDRGDLVRVRVTTATRSKELRAEPVLALYEQGKVWHHGHHPLLENEMVSWVPGKGASPNRIDALVWGFTELYGHSTAATIAKASSKRITPSRDRLGLGATRPGLRRIG